MKLKEVIKDFKFHCEFEKNLSEKTMKAYEIDLKQFEFYKNFMDLDIEKFDKYKLKEFYKMFDIKGREVISFPSEQIKLIKGNIYMVEAGNRIGYLKDNGEWLWPLTF